MHNTTMTVGGKSYNVTYNWADGKATPTSVTDSEGTEWLAEMNDNPEFQEQLNALTEPEGGESPSATPSAAASDTGSC